MRTKRRYCNASNRKQARMDDAMVLLSFVLLCVLWYEKTGIGPERQNRGHTVLIIILVSVE
jgi:hypothetical protein